MKHLRLHALSLLVGGSACAAFLFLSAQGLAPSFPSSRFSFGPHPRDFVTLREGQPYIVPMGFAFVPTAIGSSAIFGQNPAHGVTLLVDGQARLASTNDFSVLQIPQRTPRTSMLGVPTGYAALEGAVVTVTGGAPSVSDGRVWGYLSPVSAPVTNRLSPMLTYAPRAQDFLRVAGSAFVVPQGKLFVPLALGLSSLGSSSTSAEYLIWLTVNGQNEIGASVRTGDATHDEVSVQTLLGTAAFAEGSVLQVVTSGGPFEPCAWGYLADD
ncbi:MAG: hypothetical protein HZA53_16735 [Planctomycetes bacterium]|nr:hypothetical protein [Planctomycetota bacterium]